MPNEQQEQEQLLDRLANLAQTVGTACDLTTVFRGLREFVELSAPCNGLIVSLYNPERQDRTCVYAWSEGVEENVFRLPPLPMSQTSPNSRAISSGEIIVIDDLSTAVDLETQLHVDLGGEIDPRPPQSSLVVPMMILGRVIGAFEIQSIQPAAYTHKHVTSMSMAANLAAIATDNVHLLERERHLRQEAEATEREIQASLAEKEVLLKEIHHRVNNNLQIISSLLNLQAEALAPSAVRTHLREAQSRVRAIAFIHEKIYQSQTLAHIDFAEYIHSLTSYLFQAYITQQSAVSLRIEVAPVTLNIDTAVPCGLILNELMSNALKHAFPAGQAGEIRVVLQATNGRCCLIVADNGIGIPETVEIEKSQSLGLQLVNSLTRQLNGALELQREGGSEFRLSFSEITVPVPAQ